MYNINNLMYNIYHYMSIVWNVETIKTIKKFNRQGYDNFLDIYKNSSFVPNGNQLILKSPNSA
jgi:hypothetical protein